MESFITVQCRRLEYKGKPLTVVFLGGIPYFLASEIEQHLEAKLKVEGDSNLTLFDLLAIALQIGEGGNHHLGLVICILTKELSYLDPGQEKTFIRLYGATIDAIFNAKRDTKDGLEPEASVRDRLALAVGGRTEITTASGRIDILTDTEIIEVKRARYWRAALRQVLSYMPDFPGRKPRVHLYGPISPSHKSNAAKLFKLRQVSLTFEEEQAKTITKVGA